ncbi:MAG TPA: SEC-C metal-binding domain-containing protein [Thermoanaerobaculia bacterium]
MKVDEAFSAGPFTVRRAGRYTEIVSNWPAGEHEKMLERARVERPKLQTAIDGDIKRLAQLLGTHDPIPLIGALYLQNGIFDAEEYSEPSHEGVEAYVEYVHSLALAVPEMGTAPPDREQVQEAGSLVKRIFENYEWYLHLEFTDKKRKEWEYQIRFMLLLRFLKLRGSSYEQHQRELITDLFSEHDEFLARRVGTTTAQIVAAADEVERQFINAMNAQFEGMVKAKELHRRFFSQPDITDANFIPRSREFGEQIDPVDWEIMQRAFTTDPTKIQPNDKLPTSLVDRLSASEGENRAFLEDEKSKGWPVADSVIYRKPLVRRGDQYYCPNPVLLFRKLDRIIESWIREEPAYYGDKFAKKRGMLVERKAADYISKLLPGGRFHSNLYYSTAGADGKVERFETDGIITWDRALLIVESKAAGIDVPARRGALSGLREALKEIVRAAFEQGIRTRRYIESAPSVTFEDEHGAPVLTVSRDDYDDVFIVNVTLESLGFFSAGIHLLKEMGLLAGSPWPWSVFVNDLRVISEILETGSDFIAYLRSRVHVPDLPQFFVGDELDFLMAYLKDGARLADVNLDAVGMFNLHGYTVALDRYYSFQNGSVESGEKPQSETPAPLQALVELIERHGRPGFLRVTLALLQLDRATMRWMARETEVALTNVRSEGRRDQLVLRSPDRKTVVVTYFARSWSNADIEEKLAEMNLRKYNARSDRWITIFLTIGSTDVTLYDYVDHNEPWQRDEALDSTITERKRRALRSYLRDHPRPERNAACACESGRKFKDCCLSLADSV